MRHSMSKDTAFNAETTPRHTFLCTDSQCLPPGDPRILCAKHGYPITGKSFIALRVDHVARLSNTGTVDTSTGFNNLLLIFVLVYQDSSL